MKQLFIGLIAVALVAGGCQSKEPIKIGFSGGITGSNSSVAISGRNAVMLAVDEVNKTGGIKGRLVELVIKDDMEQPDTAASVDREFIAEEVPVIIGHYVSGVAAASLEAIQDQEVLMVSPTISAKELSGIDDNFIRLILPNSAQGEAMAHYAYQSVGNRKTYVVHNDGNKAFVNGVKTAYGETFLRLGGKLVGESSIPGRDMAGINGAIDEILSRDVDSILVVMNANDVALFAQQLKKSGHMLPIYSATWGMTADVITQGGSAVEGIVFPAPFDPKSQDPEFLEFKKTYEKLYGEPVDFSAVYSYESAQIVFEGLREAPDTRAAQIKEAILKKAEYQGLQGRIVLNINGDVQRPQFLTTVENGEFKTISTVN